MRLRRWYDPEAEYHKWLEQVKMLDEVVCLDEGLLDAQTALGERSKDCMQVWDWPFNESTVSKIIFDIAHRGRLTSEDKRVLGVLACAFAGLDPKWSVSVRRKGRKPIVPLHAAYQLETRNQAIAVNLAWMLNKGHKLEAAVAWFQKIGLKRSQVFAIWAKYKEMAEREYNMLDEPDEKPIYFRRLFMRVSSVWSTRFVGWTKK